MSSFEFSRLKTAKKKDEHAPMLQPIPRSLPPKKQPGTLRRPRDMHSQTKPLLTPRDSGFVGASGPQDVYIADGVQAKPV